MRRRDWIAGVRAIVMLVGLCGLAVALTARPGDPMLFPAPAGEGIEIIVISNGFHSGLVLPLAALREVASREGDPALLAVATRFASFAWIEAGWGDRLFYRAVPDGAAFDWRLALHALFAPGNASVVHIAGIESVPDEVYAGIDRVRLRLSREGFGRLARGLDGSLARDAAGLPDVIGPGLSGPSLFYEGTGTFSLLNLCNHWTARLLDLAGVPTAPALATLPAGLIWDLRLRASSRQAAAT